MTARAERNRFVFEVSIYDMRARTGRLGAAFKQPEDVLQCLALFSCFPQLLFRFCKLHALRGDHLVRLERDYQYVWDERVQCPHLFEKCL